MYDIAASVVSRVSNTTFFDFVRDNFFTRVGLADTTISSNELVKAGRVADGYMRFGETVNSTGSLHPVEPDEDLEQYAPGSGCIFSTAEDIVRFKP